MEVLEKVIISKRDFKKLLKESGIPSIYQLSKMTKIDQSTLSKAVNGKITLGANNWEKIKTHIKIYELKEIERS